MRNYYFRQGAAAIREYFVPDTNVEVQFFRTTAPAPPLSKMRARWEATRIRNYQYIYEQIDTRQQPARTIRGKVTVREGEIVAVEEAGAENPGFSDFKTIDQLFTILQSRIAVADLVTIVFDETWGFPSGSHADSSIIASDDEDAYFVKDFHPLP